MIGAAADPHAPLADTIARTVIDVVINKELKGNAVGINSHAAVLGATARDLARVKPPDDGQNKRVDAFLASLERDRFAGTR